MKNNFSLVTKICLAGLFTALAVIFQKVFAINYISAIPFLRISFGGPAIIITSSLLLGPWFGALVGGLSDLLGYLIFDPKSYAFFPQITLTYVLLGFVSYFMFRLFKKVKHQKIAQISLYSILFLLMTFLIVFISVSPELKLYSSTYVLETWQKIFISCLIAFLFLFLFVFTIIYDKKTSKNDPYFSASQLMIILFIIELLVMVVFGSIMKGWAFGFATFDIILISQFIVLFINVPLNMVIITVISKVLLKQKKIIRE